MVGFLIYSFVLLLGCLLVWLVVFVDSLYCWLGALLVVSLFCWLVGCMFVWSFDWFIALLVGWLVS